MAVQSSYPYSAIVAIDLKFNGKSYIASGVMLSPTEVLTASHAVWMAGVGAAMDIVVYPGYDNGVSQFGYAEGTATHYNAINDAGDTIDPSDIHDDFALIHLKTPLDAGFMTVGLTFSGGSAFVSGYPYPGVTPVNTQQTLVLDPYDILEGQPLGPGSSGGPVWTSDSSGASVVGVISGEANGIGYFAQLNSFSQAAIQTWLAQDAAMSATVAYSDTTDGTHGVTALDPASGGPAYLDHQYIWANADDVAMSTTMPNVFLHGGSGSDAIQVSSGQNVLDGGAGSNFLMGGLGNDTFFTDARGTSAVWSTLGNFHAGDEATLWGFTPGVSSYYWDKQVSGAPGYAGATLRANIVGGDGRAGDGIDASITFAGLSVAEAKGMQITTGTAPAGSFLHFSNITG